MMDDGVTDFHVRPLRDSAGNIKLTIRPVRTDSDTMDFVLLDDSFIPNEYTR